MTTQGRILIADDERVFRDSMCDLFKSRGYECDCVPDAEAALEMIGEEGYDLLIADIKMPGNEKLELVRDLSKMAERMPIILVTAYESMETISSSFELSGVVAYIRKPVDFDNMMEKVEETIERSKTYSAIMQSRERLKEWEKELDDVTELMRSSIRQTPTISTNAFLTMTLRSITCSLVDLQNMVENIVGRTDSQGVCRLFDCPRLKTYVDAGNTTISILEETKKSFHSKQLMDLRKMWEGLLRAE